MTYEQAKQILSTNKAVTARFEDLLRELKKSGYMGENGFIYTPFDTRDAVMLAWDLYEAIIGDYDLTYDTQRALENFYKKL